jgi:hypothetical protein
LQRKRIVGITENPHEIDIRYLPIVAIRYRQFAVKIAGFRELDSQPGQGILMIAVKLVMVLAIINTVVLSARAKQDRHKQ